MKIRQIYDRFATDRSKPFVLNKESIGEAVRRGIRAGKFGYCTKIHMAGNRFVAEKRVEDFGWDGFLVSSRMVHIDEKDPPPPPTPQEFKYIIRPR